MTAFRHLLPSVHGRRSMPGVAKWRGQANLNGEPWPVRNAIVKIINLPKDGKFEAQRSGVVRQPLISGPAPATQASLPSSHRDAGASQATDTLVCTGIHPTGEVLGPRTKPPVNQPPLQAADLIITGNRSGPPSLANWARSAVSLIAMWSRALVSAATAILPSRRAR